MQSQIANVATLVGRWRGRLLDLLFPARCVSCYRIGESLCSHCRSQIQFVTPPFCPRCSHPLKSHAEACPNCRAYPLHLTHVRAVGFHEGALREAIHALKYKRRTDVAVPLAALLQRQLLRTEQDVDLITAVPLHPDRQRQRGYNQAEILARELAPRVGLPYLDGMKRIRPTADQIGLDVAMRHENVRAAFAADQTAFRGRHVLIVDDVCTTGATLDACAVALLAQGASRIYGLTVARPR